MKDHLNTQNPLFFSLKQEYFAPKKYIITSHDNFSGAIHLLKAPPFFLLVAMYRTNSNHRPNIKSIDIIRQQHLKNRITFDPI